MATAIYSCKHCKVGKRVDYPQRDQARASWWRPGGPEGRVYPGSYIHWLSGFPCGFLHCRL